MYRMIHPNTTAQKNPRTMINVHSETAVSNYSYLKETAFNAKIYNNKTERLY